MDQPGLINSKKHRRDIDGLRAIAVLAVLGYHCGLPWLRGGFIGVDVFFVISGYLICAIIYRETQRGSFSIARFYERRFKRILPALFVVLIFCYCVGILIMSPWELRRLGETAVATSLSLSNLYFALRGNYFAANTELNPLLMTWSLAVEEQFYIFFPLLMLLMRNAEKRKIFTYLSGLSVLSLASCIYCEFHQPTWNFYMPVTRAWELGAGTLLAIWESGRSHEASKPRWKADIGGMSGLLIIIACIAFYRPSMRFPGFEAVPPVLGSVLLLASAGGLASRILAIRPLVAAGLISYSLYLWHWPLLSFARILSPTPLPLHIAAALMAVAFVAAILSFFFIETPFRTKAGSSTGRVLVGYGAVIASFVLVGGLFYVTRGLFWRAPELDNIERVAGLDRHHTCLALGDSPIRSSECAPASSSMPAIALLGDSHAEAVGLGLRDFASANGMQLLVLTKGNCPPLMGVTRWHSLYPTHAESCTHFNKETLKFVLSRSDIKLVFLTGNWSASGGRFIPDSDRGVLKSQSSQESADNLKRGLQAEITAMEATGKRVIVMNDVPMFAFDPMARVRYNYLPVRRTLTNLIFGNPFQSSGNEGDSRSATISPGAELAYLQIASIKALDPKLTVVDPKTALCDMDDCKFADGSNMYYADGDHISRLGALRVLTLLPSNIADGQ